MSLCREGCAPLGSWELLPPARSPLPHLPGRSKKKKKKEKAAHWLLWRAESYHQYPNLRRKYPDEAVVLLSPEFLIPTISLYKTLMKRIEEAGIRWSTDTQSAPHGFIGIALMIQVSNRHVPQRSL